MKAIRVMVMVVMGVSAFSGFAQVGASSSGVGAGSPVGSAVVLNRTKPATVSQEIVPVAKYPFADLQKALEKGPGTEIRSEIGAAAEASVGLGVKVPPGWESSKDVALSETAREAVALSAKLSNEQNNPVPGPDGRVVYTFGVGQPTLVATPLRVSSIELQAGEKILGEPQIGDSVRWVVNPISSGSGDAATPILVVKPKVTGLDTTMIVATDRRTYYLRLVSKPGEYVSRVAFLYPDDQPLQWKLFLEQQAKEHKDHVEASRISQTGNAAVDKLYFDYTFKVKSGANSIRPVRVLDDGEKTYIEMPSVTAFQELPTLVVQGPAGNEMVNFRVKGTTFVVDRLFVKAALLLGVGKHQELVEIQRKDALTPHTPTKLMEVK
jgi:type IV secretion system protein VirB9